MKDNNQQTRIFDSEQVKQQNIKYILKMVDDALNERGYNSVTQIVGYLVTNDPAYISSYKNARTLIQTVDRDEILKEIEDSEHSEFADAVKGSIDDDDDDEEY